MSPRRNKTGSQILKEWIKNIKNNSSPKSKKSNKANDYLHHHNNDCGGLEGSKYLEH
jgi:hypothetical protein